MIFVEPQQQQQQQHIPPPFNATLLDQWRQDTNHLEWETTTAKGKLPEKEVHETTATSNESQLLEEDNNNNNNNSSSSSNADLKQFGRCIVVGIEERKKVVIVPTTNETTKTTTAIVPLSPPPPPPPVHTPIHHHHHHHQQRVEFNEDANQYYDSDITVYDDELQHVCWYNEQDCHSFQIKYNQARSKLLQVVRPYLAGQWRQVLSCLSTSSSNPTFSLDTCDPRLLTILASIYHQIPYLVGIESQFLTRQCLMQGADRKRALFRAVLDNVVESWSHHQEEEEGHPSPTTQQSSSSSSSSSLLLPTITTTTKAKKKNR